MKVNRYLNFLLSLTVVVISGKTVSAQKVCEGCVRHGMLVEFIDINNPDNEDQPNEWHCTPSMMSVFMGERFTNPCYYPLSSNSHDPQNDKQPEYIFKGSYEGNIQGGRIIEYAEDYKRPVVAKMELSLYYNGNTPELIQEWNSENTINEPRALFNKLKTPKSLNPLFKEFEKLPVSCRIDIPPTVEICDSDTCEIILSGFNDAGGNPSREFNRILVHIFAGTILNGEDSNFGPDRKVFPVGDGTVKIVYRPPSGGDEDFDWIRVYNSCDILPPEKYPFENTLPGELIAEEEFPVTCKFDAILRINGSYSKTERSSFSEENAWGKGERTNESIERREATFYVPLQLENTLDVDIQNLRYEYYRPLDIHVSSFNASIRSKEYRSSVASDQGSQTTILKNSIASDPKLSMKEILMQNNIVMTSDLKTGKVLKIDIDGFSVEFTWEETVDTHTETWWQPPPQPGHETKDDRQSSSSDDSFHAGPVADPIPDPTVTGATEKVMSYLKDIGIVLPEEAKTAEADVAPQIEPELLVKSGDGKTYFGGSGSKIIDNSKESTVKREEFSFSWQATRKKNTF